MSIDATACGRQEERDDEREKGFPDPADNPKLNTEDRTEDEKAADADRKGSADVGKGGHHSGAIGKQVGGKTIEE